MHGSEPEDDVGSACNGGEGDGRASVVACCDAAPVLEASEHDLYAVAPSVAAPISSLTWPAVMKKLKGRLPASVMARSLMFMLPFVRSIRRSTSPFYLQAGSYAMRLQIGRVDHHRLALGNLGRSQTFHHLQEDVLSPHRFQRL